jgi:hypothetical protein
VVWLLLWPLQESGPVRRCETNSLPRGSAPRLTDKASVDTCMFVRGYIGALLAVVLSSKIDVD